MRWLAYFILAYVALGLQVGVADLTAWHGARPNLVLVAALFVALNAPRDAALLGAFALGLLQDLLSLHPPGLYALAYGLFALACVEAQQVVYRNHPLMHAALALVGGLLTATVLAVYTWAHPAVPRTVENGLALGAIGPGVGPAYLSAVYTAALAPALLWPLNRARRAFAFQGSYRQRGW